MDRQVEFIIEKGISLAGELCGPEIGLRVRLLRPKMRRSFQTGGGFCFKVKGVYRVGDAYLFAVMITRTMVRLSFRETPTSEQLTSFEREFLVDDEEEVGLAE